jgi:hypothetical protein
MPKYLIETPHTERDCRMLIDQIHAAGYLHHFDWGCEDGVHCGWAILEAEDKSQAMLAIPALARPEAQVVRLTKFTRAGAKDMHRG